MQAPTQHHFQLLKRARRYVKGTVDLGMRIRSVSSGNLYAFADVDWGGCPLTR